MSRRKEVTYLNRRLRGKDLTELRASKLEAIMELHEKGGYIPELKNMIYNLSEEDIDTVLQNGSNEGVNLLQGELRDGQTLSVGFMYYSERCVIGDSVGLGKTVEASGFLNLLDAKYAERGAKHRYLVVTEGTVVNQFMRELVCFTGDYVEMLPGTRPEAQEFVQKYGVDFNNGNVIGPASLLKQPIFQEYLDKAASERAFPFDTLIVDESAVLASTTTQVYKEAMAVIGKRVKNVVLMNATPFEDNLKQFYAQLNFADPTLLPTKTDFEKRYFTTKRSAYGKYGTHDGGYKNQEELRRLVGYRYFKRTRKESGAEFSKNTAKLIILPRSRVQRELLATTSMPQMVYDNPSAFREDIEYNAENVPKAGKLLDVLKGKEDIPGGWEDAMSVLVYSHFKESQHNLKEFLSTQGIEAEVMNGDTPQEERLSLIKGFQEGRYRVLITNVMKGLNFGNCNHIVVFSVPGNTNKIVQFEGRATRGTDIINKHLLVLVTDGDESKRVKTELKAKAKASNTFTGEDYSLFNMLITGEEV